MKAKIKLLIGGKALQKLGSSRTTSDTDYLVNDTSNSDMFIFDTANNIDYCNANGSKFFTEIWKMEKDNETGIASPQALLELKAYSFVQHCQNFNFQKADDAEYDIKFLVRKFNLKSLKIASKFLANGELSIVEKIINSTKIADN